MTSGGPRRVGCAALARRLGETVHGSAPDTCRAWLLVEHPGPWPAFGVPRGIGPAVGELLDQAPAFGVRPQFVRRPDTRRQVPPHRVFVAHSGPQPWAVTRELDDLNALLDLDLAAIGRGTPPTGFAAHPNPLLLVCTHGKREPCCAEFGRPTVRALHRAFGDHVWETTHVGGDRFAANVVTLPAGTYHGLVTEPVAETVGAACLRGDVDLAHYRGRAGQPAAVQAAEWFARRARGVYAVDAVRTLAHTDHGDGSTSVDLDVAGTHVNARVRAAGSGCPRLTSCSEGVVTDPHTYLLDSLRTT